MKPHVPTVKRREMKQLVTNFQRKHVVVGKGKSRKERRKAARTAIKNIVNEMLNEEPQYIEGLSHEFQSEFPVGIVCLTKTHKSLLVWAHYAAAHTGFVLEFDSTSSGFKRLGALQMVTYTDSRPVYDGETGQHDLSEQLFSSKSPEWNYEQEYRMFRPFALCETETTPSGIRYFAKLEKKCVKAVYLGCRSDATLFEQAKECLAGTEISLFKAKLSKDKFELAFDRIR